LKWALTVIALGIPQFFVSGRIKECGGQQWGTKSTREEEMDP
jgi:hypothetical protein